jgi:hypothetical protein
LAFTIGIDNLCRYSVLTRVANLSCFTPYFPHTEMAACHIQHDEEYETDVDVSFNPEELEPRRKDGEPLTRQDISHLILQEIAHYRPDAARFIGSIDLTS